MINRGFTDLDDMRLVHRGTNILNLLFRRGTHSIRQLCETDSQSKAVYRFLNNDRVTEDDIIANMVTNCQKCCAGKFVVVIQDTTESNVGSHAGRLKRDGFIGAMTKSTPNRLGFFIHPSLVLDGVTGVPYGYSDVKLWSRPLELTDKKERNYQSLPVEEKESFKWIESSLNTIKNIGDQVEGMLIIQDREGDIYDQFATVPNENVDLLIRSKSNRTLLNGEKLIDHMKKQPVSGYYQVEVNSTKGKKRTANLELRFSQVSLLKPSSAKKEAAKSIDLYCIEAVEIGYKGDNPLHWRILTSLQITDLNFAKACIEWYSWRWTIEEVFKILKKEGFDIEASELEKGESIRKLSLLIMEAIIKIFLLRIAYNEPEEEGLPPEACFTKKELQCMEEMMPKVEGKTHKQKNPTTQKTLKRYAWLIARLGGWKGYESNRVPGITCYWIGLDAFSNRMQGWEIGRNVSTR